MTKEIIAFGNNEIEKRKFHYCKTSILLEDVDIGNILISTMVSCGEKNNEDDDYSTNSLHIMLPKSSATYIFFNKAEIYKCN